MSFTQYTDASHYASAKQKEADKESNGVQLEHFGPLDPTFYKYCLKSQEQMEEECRHDHTTWDYKKFCYKIWHQLVTDTLKNNSEAYGIFEGLFLNQLHRSNTRKFVFKDLISVLPKLIDLYALKIRMFSLWSVGDVGRTGQQISKIDNTDLQKEALSELKKQFGTDQQALTHFIQKRIQFMVDDDKFSRIARFAKELLHQNPGQQFKFAIVEDTLANFDAVREVLKNTLGDTESLVTIVPVWVIRKLSQKERTDAHKNISTEQDDQSLKDIKIVEEFNEFLNTSEYESIFSNAYVFVDFDGVIIDDSEEITARYTALRDALYTVVKKYGSEAELRLI